MERVLARPANGQLFRTETNKKRLIGLLFFLAILAVFFTCNRFPKLDIVEGDLAAVSGSSVQCFQGFCLERDPGTSFLSRWVSFSVTYLRLVTVGMTFAFVVAGLAEAFLFPRTNKFTTVKKGTFKRTFQGVAVGPVMNLCSACIVPVSAAFRQRGGGIEGTVGMVQGSATLNIPAILMTFFVFTPLLGFSRLLVGLVGAVVIAPIVARVAAHGTGSETDQDEVSSPVDVEPEASWSDALTDGSRNWAKSSLGYFAKMGWIMVVAGFMSGLAMQWITEDTVTQFLGNNVQGVVIAATFGILINVPLLFEIPLVALLLLIGMGTAPAATLLFAAAAGGPITFWGLAKIMPRRAIVTFAVATWAVAVVGGVCVLGLGWAMPDLYKGETVRGIPTSEVSNWDNPVPPVVN